ncbi:MAG: alpha/beta fold hydrolase [Candidatus Hodarchaeota archaeon]
MAEIVRIGVKYLSGRYDFLEGLEGQLHINFEKKLLTFELSEKHAKTRPIRIRFVDITHLEPQVHGTFRKNVKISLGYRTRKPGSPDIFELKDSWVKFEDIEAVRDRVYEFREEEDEPQSPKAPVLSSIAGFAAELEKLGKSLMEEVTKASSGLAKTGEKVVRPPPPKPPEMESKFKDIYISDLALSAYDSSWELGPYRRKGAPLVFIHGIGCGAWVWNHLLARLCRKRRVIGYDLRGHGQSEKPKNGYDATQHSQDLIELLDILEVPRPRILIAHSISGMIALQHALDNPDTIAGMILIAAWAKFPPDIQKAAKLVPPIATWGPLKGKARKMAPGFLLANPESYLSKIIVPRIEKTPDRVLSASIKEIVRKSDFTGRLKELDQPVLILRGTEDRVHKKEDSLALANELPRSKYEDISRTGHFPQLERPLTTYRTILKYLKAF